MNRTDEGVEHIWGPHLAGDPAHPHDESLLGFWFRGTEPSQNPVDRTGRYTGQFGGQLVPGQQQNRLRGGEALFLHLQLQQRGPENRKAAARVFHQGWLAFQANQRRG